MSNQNFSSPRSLPERPNLRHLKDQAKDLLKAGHAATLSEAQLSIAKLYGFPSWPKLKAHISSLEEIGQLKLAIDRNDLDRVKALMTRNPTLHRAPLGYGEDGPLTWVAECRVPWEPPSDVRLRIARWMIENGSDVHQGGDGPLGRAALRGERIPMMDLLLEYGADVNAEWRGNFPIIYFPCESVSPAALQYLLEHGADPNCAKPGRGTALDYLISGYVRSPRLATCVDLLVNAGGTSRYNQPGIIDTILDRVDNLQDCLNSNPQLINQHLPDLDFGSTGGRRLLLNGATLLHVAAEYGSVNVAKYLLERGADVNTRADVNHAGIGGQTPVFHAATQFDGCGLPMTRLLLEYGADLDLRVKLPGHYERPDEVVECTPLEYALLFPGDESPGSNAEIVKLLRERQR